MIQHENLKCHQLVLFYCCFGVVLKSIINAKVYQEILKQFMLPSADKLYRNDGFLFQQDLVPAHSAKTTKRFVLIGQPTCQIWNL